MTFAVMGGSPTSGYQINNSLRFRASASAYLNRTQTAGSSRTKFTLSWWAKKGATTSSGGVEAYSNSSNFFLAGFDSSNNFILYSIQGGVDYGYVYTPVYRDPAAWYHIVVSVDTTLSTASDRFRLYINGIQVTAIVANYGDPPLNYVTDFFNTGFTHSIGRRIDTGAYFDGYMAEFNVIDGQALTPSSFGSTNPLTGVWQPAKYTGTYGTNGFYLPFSNTTSATTLAYDASGNGNNWTANNISTTAGVTYDAMIDSPTMAMTSTTQPVGNYATLNTIDSSAGITITNANLSISSSGLTNRGVRSTIALPSTGLFYFEATSTGTTSATVGATVGLANTSVTIPSGTEAVANVWGLYASNQGFLYANGTAQTSGLPVISNGITYQVAYDAANNRAWIGRSNVWYNSTGGTTGDPATGANPTFTSLPSVSFFLSAYNGMGWNANFGQRPFAYTPPTGFKALCTTNLPDSTIPQGNKVMDATLFTGNVSGATVTNAAGFKPDFVWRKTRDVSQNNGLYDSVRGGTKELVSNATSAETTNAGLITSFNSNGFTYGNAFASANSYVAWQWQAGQGTSTTNTDGTLASVVSVNRSSGFSIVTFTATGAVATIGHGLGVAPSMVITKTRNSVAGWASYHASLGNTKGIYLEQTAAAVTSSAFWNNTSPTSSVFTIGTGIAGSGTTMVAYCFAEIAGFSKFGSYTGNGSTDGPFVYCGFRPKYIMLKSTSTAGSNWWVEDTSRSTYNAANALLFPNLSNAEYTTAGVETDILSNGFKLRTTNGDGNKSGDTFIYMAFAENPFKNALAR